MDAQVAAIVEQSQHGVRDRADPQLQRRAVLDQAGHVPPDLHRRLVGVGHAQLGQRVVHRDGVVDARDVNEGIAQCARHLLVHFGDDHFGHLRRRLDQPGLNAQAAEPVLIRGTDVNQGGVEWELAVAEQQRHLREEARRKVTAAFVDRRAHVVANEQRVDAQVLLQAGRGVRRVPDGEHLGDLHIGQLVGPRHQCTQQLLRHRTVAGQEDAAARSDDLDRFLGSGDPRLILRQPVHSFVPPRPPNRDRFTTLPFSAFSPCRSAGVASMASSTPRRAIASRYG